MRLTRALLAAAAAAALAACGAQAPAAQPAQTSASDAGATGQENAVTAQPAGEGITTPSGLQFIELAPGTGDKPKAGDVVEVHYRGTLADGTQFDSSYSRGQPIQFVLGAGAVIPGWDEGIALMRKGGKAKLIIPPNLAYGERGAGGVIPPNATLTFEVELVEIRAGAPSAPAEIEEGQFTTTPSGLKYYDIQAGTGAEATAGKTVAVHYTGWLTDGQRFDTSRDPSRPMGRQQPFTFTLGRGEVIPGWDEGVAGMKVGGKRQLVIPPNLAYGERGAGGVIPPNATLVFEVELIEVK
jgi:peptidylprolyl isomerase